jgi:hypothetical protein
VPTPTARLAPSATTELAELISARTAADPAFQSVKTLVTSLAIRCDDLVREVSATPNEVEHPNAAIEDGIADVVTYAIQVSDLLGIDLVRVIEARLPAASQSLRAVQ